MFVCEVALGAAAVIFSVFVMLPADPLVASQLTATPLVADPLVSSRLAVAASPITHLLAPGPVIAPVEDSDV